MPKQQKGSNKRRITIILIILLLLIAVIGLWFWYQSQAEEEVSRDLSSGILPGSSEVDYSDAAEESIRIQINSQPVFETGESEGNLYIGNPEPNQYDMEVIITLEQTGDEIYNSGYIPPGYYIDNDRLDVVLEAGEHAAVAAITYYTEAGAVQSRTNVKLTIIVNA